VQTTLVCIHSASTFAFAPWFIWWYKQWSKCSITKTKFSALQGATASMWLVL